MVILLFLVLAVVVSWKALLSNGNFVYRDEWTILNMEAFEEYFFHIHKQHIPDFDFHKRIPELWIHFFIDYETYDKIKFTLLAFLTLLSSFYVSNKILKHENINGKKRLLTASFTAISYLVNPLNTQVFLSYYPTINYILFPLFFYFLYIGIKNYNLPSTLISALIASFMFLMVVHSLLYVILAFPIILVALLKRPLKFVPLLRSIAVFSLVFVSSTAFVLLPYLHTAIISGPSEGSHTLVQGMLNLFSSVAYLPKAMLFDFHVFWWPYVGYAYPFGGLFFLLAFLFSSILIIQAIFDRNEWATMSLVGLLLLFFLSKGNNLPFPSIYEFLNFRLPIIGWLFRVPMKFAHIIPFFFSVLFLRCSVFTAKRSKSLFYAFSIYSVAFLAIFSWPFFTGDMGGYLTKTNFDSTVADLKTIDSVIAEDDSAVLAYGIDWGRKKDISADIIAGDGYVMRELAVYANYKNWSGLHIVPFFGAQYLLAPMEIEEDIGLYSEQISKGSHYSLFIMKPDVQTIQIPLTSYLCYCHQTIARSIIRDPPQTAASELLIFPYSQLDFPREHIDAADYVVVDSVPLDFTSIEQENTFSYFAQTFESKPSKT